MAMNESEKKKIWDKYIKTKSPELREQLIVEYANLVNLVAGRMGMYLGYTGNMTIWWDMVYLD